MSAIDEKGFSLLELMVALAVVALLFVILVPTNSRGRGHIELASSAREVAAALRLARSEAIAANRPMAVVVDVQNDFYRPPRALAPRPFPRGTRIALYTTEDEELSEAVGTIRFYPDGSSTGGGVGLSLGDDRYDVLVDWLTGGVSIHERAEAPRR